MRIKNKDIPPLRAEIAKAQEGKCWLCQIELKGDIKACLDHDHRTGLIRGVLCGNCNGIEGKISNLANRAKRTGTRYGFVARVLAYWDAFSNPSHGLIHPKHKTADEKRIRRNKKAKAKRMKKKQAKA